MIHKVRVQESWRNGTSVKQPVRHVNNGHKEALEMAWALNDRNK